MSLTEKFYSISATGENMRSIIEDSDFNILLKLIVISLKIGLGLM
jgi:hypothetical protein